MKNGMFATCTGYRTTKDIDITFEDGTVIQHIQKKNFYSGGVVNPNSSYNPYIRVGYLPETNPNLLEEWDYSKNSIDPSTISKSYKDKVWWKCHKGHSWQATVCSRANKQHGTGCPYCKGNRVIEGETDFETNNPELMKDWDYVKNEGIDPKKISANSGVRVWWKCHFCGKEWQTKANNRSSLKRGCPVCSKKSTSYGEQALFYYVKMIYPNAVNRYRDGKFELDVYIPEIKVGIEFDGVYFHSGNKSEQKEQKKFEMCKEKGVFLYRVKDSKAMHQESVTADRCVGVDNLQDTEGLETAIRVILSEIDSFSNRWARKSPYHCWSSIDNLVNVERDHYKINAHRFQRDEEESFLNYHPELAEEWDYESNGGINPKSVTKCSGKKYAWKCQKCGYRWKQRVQDRAKGRGCPCCNRTVLVKGVNDFATLHPEALKEWDWEENSVPPSEVIVYDIPYAWKCQKCGHKWKATITDKVIRKDHTGCPKCAHEYVSHIRHLKALRNGSLFEKYPEMKKYWSESKNIGVNVDDIAPGTSTKYWWICPDCNYEWQASPANRTYGGITRGCPKCRYKKRKKVK
ncbi:MAG: hypothetical protein MJ228_02750 [Bacilli bacterium]|nr:hypothetical protein [Bacilli bacterium]